MSLREAPSSAFSPRLVVALVVAAAAAIGILIALATFHDELGGGKLDNGDANALSRSAIGYAGLVDLLNDSGWDAFTNRDPGNMGEDGVLVLAPRPETAMATSVKALSFRGPRLVVLQKWQTAPQRRHPNWVDRVAPYSPLERAQVLGDLIPGGRLQLASPLPARHHLSGVDGTPLAGLSLTTGPIASLQTLQPASDLLPVLVDDAGAMVIGRYKVSGYYVDAEPDLFSNHGLKDAGGAETALAILERFAPNHGPVIFDLTLNGFSSANRGLSKALLTPPLLPATLSLVLAAIIMAAHAFGRFGPAKAAGRVFAFGKRALADNTAALIHLARRERSMASPYAVLTRDLVLEAVGAPRDMPAQDADAFLDRLGVTRGVAEPWTSLKSEAAGAANADDLTRSAKKLFLWRLEMTRERR